MLCRSITGKVLMNIVMRVFSIEHTEKLVALSKKVDRGKLMRKNLRAHESDYTQQNTQNQNTFKSRLKWTTSTHTP
jgi:hypothetical protein